MATANTVHQQPPVEEPTPTTPADMIRRNRNICLTASSAFICVVTFCVIWSQVGYYYYFIIITIKAKIVKLNGGALAVVHHPPYFGYIHLHSCKHKSASVARVWRYINSIIIIIIINRNTKTNTNPNPDPNRYRRRCPVSVRVRVTKYGGW